MNYSEIANEHNKKVNGLAGQLEKIKNMMVTVGAAQIGAVDDARVTHYLEEYLREDQQQIIKDTILDMLDNQFVSKEKEFNKLLGICKADETVEAVDVANELYELLSDSKDEETIEVKKETGFTLPERILQSDFIKDYESGMSKQGLATKYDIAPTTVYGYASKLGIKRKSKGKGKEEQVAIELKKDFVREIYTLTDRSLDDVAEELGVTKFELHDFIAKNGLRRASKKEQEVFRDTEVQKKKLTPSKAN